jgi:uncharacterized protein YlbG (UPF0298 family)
MGYSYGCGYNGGYVVYDSRSHKYLLINHDSIASVDHVDTQIKLTPISCIIGIIQLKLYKYLVIADKHKITGSILNHPIAKIESYQILPIKNNNNNNNSTTSSSDNHGFVTNQEEKQYLELLNQHLRASTLYFSIDNQYDLTNNLQTQFVNKNSNYDVRFWWNYYLCQPFLQTNVHEFITPIIYGYFKSHQTNFNGNQSLEFALLTRRSIYRAGTRYFRRGIDSLGNVANFNETEQILTTNSHQIYSFLQSRGSVPVYWAEINNLKYKPNLVVSSQPNLDATIKHFQQQIDLYGDNYCVNLVNHSGYEAPIKKAFESTIDSLPKSIKSKVNYIYFDFHHECSKMRWDRIKLLLDHLVDLGYTSSNYFHYDLSSKKIISTQNKIVRTNCMDCLDRTNVVQSTIARWVLQNQFTDAGYLSKENVTPWEIIDKKFNFFYQSFWADNADAVSCAYSGTGALKTDFTRLGKRTKKGALNDLQNSISRYYKNNLRDGNRQDGYDLFLGLYKPYQDNVNSPFMDQRTPYDQLLPYLMGTSLLILLAIINFPRGSLTNLKNLIVIGGVLLFNVNALLYINKSGYQFVNWPKLVELDYLKKVEVFDSSRKVIGTKFEELDNYKLVGKKSS